MAQLANDTNNQLLNNKLLNNKLNNKFMFISFNVK